MHGQLPARAEGPLYAGTLQWGVAETQHFVNPYFSMQVTQFRRNSTPCMVNTRGPKARTVCRGFSQWGGVDRKHGNQGDEKCDHWISIDGGRKLLMTLFMGIQTAWFVRWSVSLNMIINDSFHWLKSLKGLGKSTPLMH